LQPAAKILLAGSTFITLLLSSCIVADREHKRSFIPPVFKTRFVFAEGNCGGLLSYQGAQAYKLQSQVVTELQEKGRDFFRGANGGEAQWASSYFYGGNWTPTPIVDARAGDGPLALMHCAKSKSWLWPSGIAEAAERPGGYYKAAGGRWLIVLPQQGYLVAIASDR
jgi:hypothetical protein